MDNQSLQKKYLNNNISNFHAGKMDVESYLMETDRKKPTMTQDIFDSNQETIPQNKKQKQQNGYLGEITFQSNAGDRYFKLYNDSSLGLGQGCQSILIDQEWDEDIETDYSCAENAVQKCIRQLNQAMRHQKKGIDPTRPFIHDYSIVEERFKKENDVINKDYKEKRNDFGGSEEKMKLADSPLIQSRSRIFSQMHKMMNQLDIQQSYVNQQQTQFQEEDILMQETQKDSEYSYDNISKGYSYQPITQGNFYQTQNTVSEFDPYFYQKISCQNTQESCYRFQPDYPSIPSSYRNSDNV